MRIRITTGLSVTVLASLLLATTASCVHSQETPAYKDPKAPLNTRVEDLFQRLTPDEKLSLLTGGGFNTHPIPRLDVPGMYMVDGGQGVRGGSQRTQGPATAFPGGVNMAATWDRDLLRRIGRAIGEEALHKGEGAQVLLGPDVNIHRSPLGGRNGESFSEDPFVVSQLVVPYVEGVQSSGAAACVKHFACNNEEVDRNTVDVRVDERALREIYLPAFEAGVRQGHSWTVMAAYNKINGPYATANRILDTDLLKKEWGFDGLLMSDWGAVHETAAVVNAGNDLEMPGGQFLTTDKLKTALADGSITQAGIDDAVRRILRTIVRVHLLDGPTATGPNPVNSPEHQKLAYETAAKSIVLLKNDHQVLPLDRGKIRSLAVIGPAAVNLQIGALGSPAVQPFYTVKPLDGIKERAGNAITLNYVEGMSLPKPFPDPIPTTALTTPDGGEHGLRGEYFASEDLQGTPVRTGVDPTIQFFRGNNAPGAPTEQVGSVRWTGKLTAPMAGSFTLSLFTGGGCRLFIDDKPIINDPPGGRQHKGTVALEQGKTYDLRLELVNIRGPLRARLGWTPPTIDEVAAAAATAAKSDAAVVFVTTGGTDGEGRDRPSLALPNDQDRLIQAVAAANKNTIVVLNTGTPVLMNAWLAQVPALLNAGYPGQEGGRAIADILFGEVDPSGKLVDTFGARREDYPDFGNFPGVNDTVHYTEGIYVGYRHFDKQKIQPVFPFGYGLSYTTFRYGHLKLSQSSLMADGSVTASVDITNTGKRAGAEVVELYVRDTQPKVDKPIRELKGFERVELKPGETRTVTFTVTPSSLSYFDVSGSRWKADAGSYAIEIGASSRDIRLTAPLRLTATYERPVR